ncbi:hypothetical protein [Flavobacterium seoulense]|uniref:Uncharacterized protein n=1 Tax=Flavobacterium seoulense TaxID=1492738 RepID=A0A066WMK3_9FLAO|nr:hypothetical protein [Flavobacterium seoulense]KDN55257.1 hypothetical protein FEM21_18480 [Flavobacterium seoulense]
MKLLSLLFLTIFLGKGCEGNPKQNIETAKIIYTAHTRGYHQEIIIENKLVSVKKDRKEEAVQTKIKDADWKELVRLFQETDLEELKELKSPTEKRFYDGAAIANLTIIYEGKIYESQSFDHGFPPVEIKKIVTKINSFAKQNNEDQRYTRRNSR